MPARPAQGTYLLAVTGIREARPDQRLTPGRLRQRSQRVEGIAQGGVVSQLLQGLIVIGDAGAGVAVPARLRALRGQFAPALAQQGGLAGAVGAEQRDLVSRPQPEPFGAQQRRQCWRWRYVECLQSQQRVGRQAHSAQLEPPGASAATWLCSSCRRAMRFSMDLV